MPGPQTLSPHWHSLLSPGSVVSVGPAVSAGVVVSAVVPSCWTVSVVPAVSVGVVLSPPLLQAVKASRLAAKRGKSRCAKFCMMLSHPTF